MILNCVPNCLLPFMSGIQKVNLPLAVNRNEIYLLKVIIETNTVILKLILTIKTNVNCNTCHTVGTIFVVLCSRSPLPGM